MPNARRWIFIALVLNTALFGGLSFYEEPVREEKHSREIYELRSGLAKKVTLDWYSDGRPVERIPMTRGRAIRLSRELARPGKWEMSGTPENRLANIYLAYRRIGALHEAWGRPIADVSEGLRREYWVARAQVALESGNTQLIEYELGTAMGLGHVPTLEDVGVSREYWEGLLCFNRSYDFKRRT